jgi:hypothetical protein
MATPAAAAGLCGPIPWPYPQVFGDSFVGQPGTVWVNTTDRIRYQLTPSFRACCGVCFQYAHHVGFSWPIPFHYGCECIQKAIMPGESSLPFLDLAELLRPLTPAQQDALMGRDNWLLFRDGLVRWEDVVAPTTVHPLHAVVCGRRIGVGAMVKAGVSRDAAEEAYRLALGLANDSKRRMRERLRGKGWDEEQIARTVGRDVEW